MISQWGKSAGSFILLNRDICKGVAWSFGNIHSDESDFFFYCAAFTEVLYKSCKSLAVTAFYCRYCRTSF